MLIVSEHVVRMKEKHRKEERETEEQEEQLSSTTRFSF
jgi:hypothetical protein